MSERERPTRFPTAATSDDDEIHDDLMMLMDSRRTPIRFINFLIEMIGEILLSLRASSLTADH